MIYLEYKQFFLNFPKQKVSEHTNKYNEFVRNGKIIITHLLSQSLILMNF